MIKLTSPTHRRTLVDITVFITVFIDDKGSLCDMVTNEKFKLNIESTRPVKKITPRFVTKGFQTYKNEFDANQSHMFPRECTFECIIPKGSMYFEGTYKGKIAYISDRLILIKQKSWKRL